MGVQPCNSGQPLSTGSSTPSLQPSSKVTISSLYPKSRLLLWTLYRPAHLLPSQGGSLPSPTPRLPHPYPGPALPNILPQASESLTAVRSRVRGDAGLKRQQLQAACTTLSSIIHSPAGCRHHALVLNQRWLPPPPPPLRALCGVGEGG